MALSKTERLSRVHTRMIQRFERVWTATRDERMQCLEDRRFCYVTGAQWEGPLSDQFANRPKLEMNKVRKAVNRIVAEFRQNRIEAHFLARKQNSPAADSIAGAATSMYRATNSDPLAQAAKDNAFEEAASGGIGAWRLRPVYEDERDPGNEQQRIATEPIYDADIRVFLDNNALRPDKSDAKWGFIITPFTREAYEDTYDEDPTSWPVENTLRQFDWITNDTIFVAEYYEIVKEPSTLRIYRHLDGTEQRVMARDVEADPELIRWLGAVGAKKIAERQIDIPTIRKYIANGDHIVEDCGRIPGEYIPIILTYGQRAVVDGIERCCGAVRIAKDPQRLKNMLTSKLADISATGSVRKPLLFPEQIAGHTTMWAEDNIKNNPYLLINKMMDKATGQLVNLPIGYLEPPTVPAALGTLLELSEFDIKDLLGSTEQAEKVAANVSEETVSMAQQQIDLQSYVYVSNFQRAERYAGLVWLSMAEELFVERGRKIMGKNAEGQPESVELQKRSIDQRSGMAYLAADFSNANELDLDVSYGPSSASRRTSTVRELTKILGMVKDTETVGVLEALTLMNVDGEGMSDTRRYFRKKLLALGAIEPTEAEKAEIAEAAANKPEDPNSEYLRAAAENEVAKAIKARADTLLALARAQESRVKAASMESDVERSDVDQLVQLSNELGASQPGVPSAPTQPTSAG